MTLYSLSKASEKTNNIIYNSPHSGEEFPSGFLKSVQIDKHTLLSSADSFVNLLFDEAPNNGSTLLANNYSRSFMDTNREAYEIDPDMFSGDINVPLNSTSQKVKMGFGSIAKYAYTRKNIYRTSIPFTEAQLRIEEFHSPIHEKLGSLLNEEFDKFGYSLLVDCHSMPSYEFLGHSSANITQPDIILGNLYGKSCHPALTDFLTRHFRNFDLNVQHNTPFAGGFNTLQYSELDKNKHAIQIEINKSLYMDEVKRELNQSFETLKIIMSSLCHNLNKEIENLLDVKK